MSVFRFNIMKIELTRGRWRAIARVQRRRQWPGAETTEVEACMATYSLLLQIINGRLPTGTESTEQDYDKSCFVQWQISLLLAQARPTMMNHHTSIQTGLYTFLSSSLTSQDGWKVASWVTFSCKLSWHWAQRSSKDEVGVATPLGPVWGGLISEWVW